MVRSEANTFVIGEHVMFWLSLGAVLPFLPYFPYSKHIHTSKLVALSEDICSQFHLQSPFLKYPDTGMYLLKVDEWCRGNDAYLVVFI